MSGGGAESLLLTRILRQARARRNTSDIPGFTSMFGAGFARGITQGQTAQLAGVSRRWYNALESGRPANYSDAFLHRIRAVLALDDDEWVIVYRIARGRAPAATPGIPLNQLLPPALLALVEQSKTWGIYLSDQRWDVLACNEKIQEYFPWMGSGPNIVEWVLTWPEARAQLINWQTDWALPTIAALRVNAEQWPNDKRLQEVIETVRLDPTARKLWNSPDLPAVSHPASSSPRRLYLPQQEDKEFAIRIVSLTPMELPGCRLIAITPAELVSTG
ncbi:helix-turn-helix domain-containing protein [Streptomyces sp. NBC_01092]|uniref:MmyB family transcriptional regulator n=1 Tax=Streptomyces sp. NBC_01092 TaxID=2903748 RepID=UPI0038632BC9|nr:helix-turn-helix transcriptional regulator [Streptomyces sp. NBC_01092]